MAALRRGIAVFIMANPNDIRGLFDQALRKHQAGHFSGAEKLYRRVLDANPKHRDSLHLLGAIRFSEKKFKEAITLIEKALGLGPDVAAICFNLARAYEETGQLDQALLLFERAKRVDPRDADISFGIGNVLSAQNKYAEALEAFDRTLALNPRHADAHGNKGVALKNLDRFEEAFKSYDAALAINAKHKDALINRGALLQKLNRFQEAEDTYSYVLSLDANMAEAYFELGKIHSSRKQHVEAIQNFQSACRLQPDNAEWLANLLTERSKICDWTDFDKHYRKLRRELEKAPQFVQPLTVARLFDAPDLMLKTAKLFSTGQTSFERQPFVAAPLNNRQIKIGYISSDLHAKHPVYQAIEGVLKHHDRDRFDINYFVLPVPAAQPLPDFLAGHQQNIHVLQDHNHSANLELIRSHNLDIAIDLNGFTKFHRIDLFKAGIAAVQVNYLGSPGSLGSPAHDYIIGDSVLIPASHFAQYTEHVAWMPHSFFPVNDNRPVASATPTRTAADLPEKGFVFGYFGMPDRILPEVFSSWMKILKSVDESVLWLKTPQGLARENLLKEVEKHGVDTHRIVFAERTESNADHLARLKLMDLCLDTLPYNAHMTGLDCLFAGVPVLTLKGEIFAARVAASLLNACGLAELICSDRSAYEATAISLAKHADSLVQIKTRLQQHRATAALFDTKKYTRDLEKAFIHMLQRNAAGLPPEHFGVT